MVAWWLLTAAIGFGLMAGVSGVQGRSDKVIACLFALSLSLSVALSRENEALSWAPIRRESRPWTYWWWLGSAVTKEEITRHMELFKQAGLGGVHIIPIYGAQGYEDRYIPYLSDRWLEMLAHTLEEGQRLGGEWALYAVIQVLHGMKVKGAAPGGEGLVIDFFSRKAMHRFLEP